MLTGEHGEVPLPVTVKIAADPVGGIAEGTVSWRGLSVLVTIPTHEGRDPRDLQQAAIDRAVEVAKAFIFAQNGKPDT